MHNLTAHHLHFSLEVETTIELNEHKGSALRGLLFHALRGPQGNPALGFCVQRHLRTCAECSLVAACPVASLVSTLNPEAERGRDVPRPYAIKPPLDGKTRYEPGEPISFGLTLFGEALNLFPYIVMALRQAGAGGWGKKLPRPEKGGRPYRGRFRLQGAQALNLLTGEVQEVLQPGNSIVQRPDLPVTETQIAEWSEQLLSQPTAFGANGHSSAMEILRGVGPGPVEINLEFRTPLRIVEQDRLLKEPHFGPLFHRLLDRLMALSREFCRVAPQRETETTAEISLSKNRLLALSDQVELAAHATRWQEVWSYSARRERRTPIGGLIGWARYRATREVWTELLPYLLWGSIIHVGKNAVKGDGMIAVSR
jgi:hypothetical protein